MARYQTALELRIAFNVKVCFVVMPYGRKPTQAEAGKGPAQIDFNALSRVSRRRAIEIDMDVSRCCCLRRLLLDGLVVV